MLTDEYCASEQRDSEQRPVARVAAEAGLCTSSLHDNCLVRLLYRGSARQTVSNDCILSRCFGRLIDRCTGGGGRRGFAIGVLGLLLPDEC